MANKSSTAPNKSRLKKDSKLLNRQGPMPKCERCGAIKVAHSHPQSIEEYWMCLVPKSPYRCLQCYHRFWKWESLFASTVRTRVWLFIAVLVLAASYWLFRAPAAPSVTFNGYSELAPVKEVQPAESGNVASSPSTGLDASNSAATITSVSRPNSEELSPSELEREVKIAKANSKLAQRENEKRKVMLQERVLADMDEIRSLLKVDISYGLERWRHAWEAGQVDYYLSFYSKDFKPNKGLSYQQWRQQRQKRVDASKNIDLTLSDFDVTFNSDNTESVVKFSQIYEASGFREHSRKQLVMERDQQEWKIISENEIIE